MNNADHEQAERRAIAWIHALFSKNGVFQRDTLKQAIENRENAEKLYDKYKRTTQTSLSLDAFKSLAVVLSETFSKSTIPVAKDFFVKFKRFPDHNKYLDDKTLDEVRKLP